MRYFLTTNASLPVNTTGGSFIFEPVGQRGGSWFGVLAVADEAAASSLVGALTVDEITEEHFNRVKKKTPHSNYSTEFQSNRAPAHEPVAAERADDPTPTSTEPVLPSLGNVDLQTTTDEPPVEPLLAEVVKKRGRR
jgi:hypothetical protein